LVRLINRSIVSFGDHAVEPSVRSLWAARPLAQRQGATP